MCAEVRDVDLVLGCPSKEKFPENKISPKRAKNIKGAGEWTVE